MRVLPLHAVDAGHHGQVGRVEPGRHDWAQRVECVEPLADQQRPHGHFSPLDDALADVVAARVAQHVVQGIILADPPGLLSDHDGELGLVFDLLALRRVDDRVAGADHGGQGLHEQHGEGRLGEVHLLDVGDVVEAHADDLCRLDGGQQLEVADVSNGCSDATVSEWRALQRPDLAAVTEYAEARPATRVVPEYLHIALSIPDLYCRPLHSVLERGVSLSDARLLSRPIVDDQPHARLDGVARLQIP